MTIEKKSLLSSGNASKSTKNVKSNSQAAVKKSLAANKLMSAQRTVFAKKALTTRAMY